MLLRTSVLEYFGLPDDFDEWALSDLEMSASGFVAPATSSDKVRANNFGVSTFTDYLHHIGGPFACRKSNGPKLLQEVLGNANDGSTVDLSGIPDVVFVEQFDLSRPETFARFSTLNQPGPVDVIILDRLSSQLDRVPPPPPPPTRDACRHVQIPLQQVELKLLHEVTARSDSLFSALSSYLQLTAEVIAGMDMVDRLRKKMRGLATNLIGCSLRLPIKVRRRANSAAFLEKLRLVHAVWGTQPTIQQLLAARDLPGGTHARARAHTRPNSARPAPHSQCPTPHAPHTTPPHEAPHSTHRTRHTEHRTPHTAHLHVQRSS